MALMEEKVFCDDSLETDHFENIQSTNWQTLRFKPPPPGSTIGWRVEFRPMDNQITTFENAAYVVVVILIAKMILHFDLDLLIPISLVEEGMSRASGVDAVLTSK